MTADRLDDMPLGVAAEAPQRGGTMARDIGSAYLAAASRLGAWVVVSAIVYRVIGPYAFGMLALVRGTIGLLNYISLGLAPALIHHAAGAGDGPQRSSLSQLYSNALAVAFFGCGIGLVLTLAYALGFNHLYRIPREFLSEMPRVVFFMGLGALLRLLSDASGAVLQVRSRIALDNLLAASADCSWAVLTILASVGGRHAILGIVAICYTISGGMLAGSRMAFAARQTGIRGPARSLLDIRVVRLLLGYGVMIVLAQLADYLYAPTDYILINRLLGPADVANYAPAVQIDAGLLLLVSGLSAVLLPKAALAHAEGSINIVRRYYVRGTLASLAMLAAAALILWAIAPWLLRIWLGTPMPATLAILPLVLTHTVIGGSSAVGRSILLAIGKARPFTAAVLLAGTTNVLCSYAFVRFLHWGLRGIVLGTIVAVVARCALWMPWYVMRTLRRTPL